MNNPLYRPPAEADSLILQVDQGCPHNRCTFCGMYRHLPYRRRPMDEVRTLIRQAARGQPDADRVFLADGDVMSRSFADLQEMLRLLNESLPRLARVSVYANGRSIAGKTAEQLRALRALKLHTLYMGLESGDEEVLKRCRKGDTAEQMIRAGLSAQEAGLRMSVKSTVFRANHSSNVVPLEGRLPRDQNRLLAELDLLLASNALDRKTPGPMPMWL